MAYVRMTKQLCDEVRAKLETMKRVALEKHPRGNLPPGVEAEIKTHVEGIIWGEYAHLKNQMPEEWTCSRTTTVRFFSDEWSPLTAENRACVVSKIYLNDTRTPPNSGYGSSADVRFEDLPPAAQAWVGQEAQWEKQRKTIAHEYKTLTDQLIGFLESHASLNTALKEMPELEMYIPSDYMRRVQQAVKKRANTSSDQKVKEQPFVDRQALAAMGVAHRIASAGS